MTKDKYISVDQFSRKHSVTKNMIYVSKGRTFPKRLIKKSISRHDGTSLSLINETYFIRRKNFRTKLWHENHELYYFFLTSMSQRELSKILSQCSDISADAWNGYISITMWTLDETSIMNYKVYKNQWILNRQLKAIVRQLFRKLKIKVADRSLSTLIERKYQ